MRKKSFVTLARISTFFFGLILLATASTTVLPQKAHALFGFSIVIDPTNLVQNTASAISNVAIAAKGYALDPLAWVLSKAVLQSVVKSTISSINHGPNGSPQFATNLPSLLQAVGDTAANQFISQLSTNGAIRSPFQTAVASYAQNQYLQSSGSNSFFSQNPFTLNRVSPNPTAFYNGDIVNGGGMSAWTSAWSHGPNNPFFASMLAASAVSGQVAGTQQVQTTELNWGQGFLASRGKCQTTTTGGATQQSTGLGALTRLTSLAANSSCLSSLIQSPGSTIKAVLDKSVGSGIDSLVNSHTLGEILTSILGQLINQAVGSGGIFGTTQPSGASAGTSGSSGSNYFSQTDSSQNAINAGLGNTFSSTITTQITSLQQFQSQWTTINTATLAANTALSASTCYPNAQNVITSTVQPVLQQAASSIAQATSGITALQNIQAQLPATTSASTQITSLSNATTAYTQLLQSGTLPTATDMAYAAAQSIDTGTTTPPSLFTEMNQFAQAAQTCTVTGT